MVVSSDDKFIIKLWDIRSLTCIQNIQLDLTNSIRFILSIPDKIVIVSSKI